MSGVKTNQVVQYTGKETDEGSVVTSRDTTTLLTEFKTLHHTHTESTRLFLMESSQGSTDTQIVDALCQGLPHLTDPVSLENRNFGKQTQGIGL